MKLLALLTLLLVGLASCTQFRDNPDAALGPSPRSDKLIDEGWKFQKGDAAASGREFDDSAWASVSVPHTWNNMDGQDGGGNYYRGPGWYRLHLREFIPQDKNIYLKFDAAATVADVYVNGQHVGQHKGNYAAFCFDVTRFLRPSDNVIAVRVDNSLNKDISPVSGDFTVFGGLYRDVHLLTTETLAISPVDDASSGVYLKPGQVNPTQAELDVVAELRNTDFLVKGATIRTSVRDSDGRVVLAADRMAATVPAGSSAEVTQHLVLNHPHLWNGIKDPYLYHVTVEVWNDGRMVDRVTQPLGLRAFEIDPFNGFILNYQSYPLHGVNRHQDRLDKGWAISPADHEEDYKLIADMGCTAVRLAHYQHAQYFYDLCDRGGMVVWAELGIVDHITESKAFADNAKQQLTELIKQSYNHPSIIAWALYNELRDRDIQAGPPEAQHWGLIYALNDLAHELDPARYTACASLERRFDHPMNQITDVIALNWYYGWYSNWPGGWPAALNQLEADHGSRPVAISEYGAGASVIQHEIPARQPVAAGPWHPEEWQMQAHETAYGAMKGKQFLWGTFLWNMFDFAIDSRAEGDTLGRNDKGLVTYDRKTKKDTYFFYQANWTTTPMVHITSARFTPRPGESYPVTVYSNCAAVELKVNGASLGSRTGTNGVFVWEDVKMDQAMNHIEAIGTQKDAVVREACDIGHDAGATTRPAEWAMKAIKK